jgi:hypothetical protein
MRRPTRASSHNPAGAAGRSLIPRAGLALLTTACVIFFGFRIVVLVGASVSNASSHAIPDLVVTLLAGIAGVAYFGWAAERNHSVVMLAFAISESCLISGAALPVFHAAYRVTPLLPVVVAVLVLVAWLYSWLEFDRVHRDVRRWTGWW